MKKYFLPFLIFALLASGVLVVSAACTNSFPTALNNYVAGQCIPSSWGNALEGKIGINSSADVTSLDYKVNHIPVGAQGQLQFYNNGAMGADPNFTWVTSTLTLNLTPSVDQISAITAGGRLNISSGGDGQRLDFSTVDGTSNNSTGGDFIFVNGNGSAGGTGGRGGAFEVDTGNGSGAGNGGYMDFIIGKPGATGNGGNIRLIGNNGGATSGNGSSIYFFPGKALGTGNDGSIYIVNPLDISGSKTVALDSRGITGNTTLSLSSASGTLPVVTTTAPTPGDCVNWFSATVLGDVICGGKFSSSTWNGLISGAYTATTSNDTNVTMTLTTSSAPDTLKLALGWTGTLADGRISSAATWNLRTSTATSTLNGLLSGTYQVTGSGITISTSTGPDTLSLTAKFTSSTLNGLISGAYAVSGGTGINISSTSAPDTVTVANIGATSILAGSSTIVSNATGTVRVSSRPLDAFWTMQAATGTLASAADCSGSICLDQIYTFISSSSIPTVKVKDAQNGDTITWNLYYGSSTAGAAAFATTSLKKVFTADQTTTATTSPTSYTPDLNSTPGTGNMLFLWYQLASTSLTHWDVYFDYVP